MKILIDTNVLIYAAKNKVDLFDAIRDKLGIVEICVPNVVEQELRGISNSSPNKTTRNDAHLAYLVGKSDKFSHIKIEGEGDDAIIKWASADQAVLTNDVELRFKLTAKGAKVFCLRQGKYVQEC